MNLSSSSSSVLHVSTSTRAQLLEEHRNILLRRRKDNLKSEMSFRNDGPVGFQRTVNVQRMSAIRQFSAPKSSSAPSNLHSRKNGTMEENNKYGHNSRVETLRTNDDLNRNDGSKKYYDYSSNPFSITRYAEVDRTEIIPKNRLETENIDCTQQNSNVRHRDMKDIPASENKISNELVTLPKSEENNGRMNTEVAFTKLKSLSPKITEQNMENSNGADDTMKDNKGNDNLISDLKLFLNDREYMRKFVMKSATMNQGIIECYVKRSKRNMVHTEYSVFLKEGDVFLMSAKKRSKKQTSNYLISLSSGDFDRYSENIVGKVRSNFVGTEFQIFDQGKSKSRDYIEVKDKDFRKELGVVIYANNILGNRGPRKMKVCINKVDEMGNPLHLWQPENKDEEMLNCFKNKIQPAINNLVGLENKQPRWNEQLGSYVLNFNGRVTMASVKNFQLVSDEDEDDVILQFGRISKDEFSMDFKWKMSPFQAFAIVLTSFDTKFACE